MSDDKETKNEILKNCEEMSRWSCKRVGQFLDEINLRQYKKVSLYFLTIFHGNMYGKNVFIIF